jgi:hypothetical protein
MDFHIITIYRLDVGDEVEIINSNLFGERAAAMVDLLLGTRVSGFLSKIP